MRAYTRDMKELLDWVDGTHPTDEDFDEKEVSKVNLNSSAKPGMEVFQRIKAKNERKRKIRYSRDSRNRRLRKGILEKHDGIYELGDAVLFHEAYIKEEKTRRATNEELIKKALSKHIRNTPILGINLSIRTERQAKKDLINALVSNFDNLPIKDLQGKTISFKESRDIKNNLLFEIEALEFLNFMFFDFCHKRNIPIPKFLMKGGMNPRNKNFINLNSKSQDIVLDI